MSVQIHIRMCEECSNNINTAFPRETIDTVPANCNICKFWRVTNPYVLNFETVNAAKEERNPAEYTEGVNHLIGDGPACCD